MICHPIPVACWLLQLNEKTTPASRRGTNQKGRRVSRTAVTSFMQHRLRAWLALRSNWLKIEKRIRLRTRLRPDT